MIVVHFHCYQWCIAFHSHVIADTWTSGQIKQWYSNPLNRLYSNTSSETLTSGSRSYGYEDQGDTFYLGKCKVLSITWRLTPLRLWSMHFFPDHVKIQKQIFGHIAQDERPILLFFRFAENMWQTPLWSACTDFFFRIIAAFMTIGGGLFISDVR